MRIGIDAGGTFTDFVVLAENMPMRMFKLRSDPVDPAAVILRGIEIAIAKRGSINSAEDVEIVHGSTVATNALLERKGARTAFVSSPGFRGLLAIGRQNRASLFALCPEERANLVPSELCFEWNDDAVAVRAALQSSDAQSVAICLLHAYRDAGLERQVEEALQGLELYVCRSSEIAPEFREYERASTTVLNAYVGPLMDRYLSRLESQCRFPIRIMQSSGGLLTAAEARRHAVRTILSGPAGGVLGARAMARRAGWPHALAFDMGGTSTDVSLVEDPFRFATEAWVEGLPVRVPMLDIHTVGAGGGSLASVDAGGRLRVGPESAGSRPGPACYGAGEKATVTDAHVVLGRIVPKRFLDGSIPIDPARSERAVGVIAQALRVSVPEAAGAIVRIANSNMERAIRVVSVEKGRDPREFPLVAFGGCGGLHACEIAEELGISRVIFPAYAGALSAVGMLLAARTRDYSAGALNADTDAIFADLAGRARTELPNAQLEYHADVRYRGQSYELTVDWNRDNPRSPFEEAYQRIYGFHDPQRAIEIVTVRVRAVEPASSEWFDSAVAPPQIASPVLIQRLYAGSAWTDAIAMERTAVVSDLDGPAIIFDYGSTIFVPGNWTLSPHPAGSLIARPSGS